MSLTWKSSRREKMFQFRKARARIFDPMLHGARLMLHAMPNPYKRKKRRKLFGWVSFRFFAADADFKFQLWKWNKSETLRRKKKEKIGEIRCELASRLEMKMKWEWKVEAVGCLFYQQWNGQKTFNKIFDDRCRVASCKRHEMLRKDWRDLTTELAPNRNQRKLFWNCWANKKVSIHKHRVKCFSEMLLQVCFPRHLFFSPI